ncbi:hypothetical protein BC643_1299 [Mangrovibacterium diazotrophicum]|uniref:Uncharacterized protein n=1 Tax=Mangrovibacterium diazotrophicum TaxID=1261403 RepID=A0A419W6E3_9BACT|nr:hypothetical protein BC643_1299 [Mangrovibacterium diazotrophicum]
MHSFDYCNLADTRTVKGYNYNFILLTILNFHLCQENF